ncbi:Tetratricopeptide TPR_2 repeat-containing protein [Spirochaeta thermophila DSM 6578]|uniref:Tetratricopeptide TPR_2 repeat-containing protein n=1 Tax=Winmispira thermophila (strain ATCC 700085 / DSM 6578 / Z-1203) TaxID=869211 RepID=G0GA12_WINT7|nr:tetratricopeptide repeat protein [Spirochaeta thermophila]AEJ61700.1 Tetratricopeptide TPR_2 repeat-containing protein [Spirochaeta thermophila DSM 6578]
MRHAHLLFALPLILASCSSQPPVSEERFEVRNQAASYLTYGWDYFTKGRYAQAEALFLRALHENLSVDHIPGVIRSYLALAEVAIARGDETGAGAALTRAEELLALTDDRLLSYEVRSGRASFLQRTGHMEEARAMLDSLIASSSDVEKEHPEKVATVYHNMALMLAREGRREEAKAYLERAAALNERAKDQRGLAANYYVLASITASEGDTETAVALLQESLSHDKRAEHAPGIALSLTTLGDLYLERGEDELAYLSYTRALGIWAAMGEDRRVNAILEKLLPLAEKLGKEEELSWFVGILKGRPDLPDQEEGSKGGRP